MANEVWKDVKGYNGRYKISNQGRIWNADRQRFLKGGYDKDGYRRVTMHTRDGKRKTEKVHRLVAIAFIPNPMGYDQINHKNEIKDDNRVENLEWCTARYNNIYSRGIPVMCVETGEVYECSVDAAEAIGGYNSSNLRLCCKNENKTCGGYHWRYV